MTGSERHDTFAEDATKRRVSLAREVWDFLVDNKKWWMLPIVVIFAFFGALMLLGGTPAAPFIYSLF
jgi:hypothetical protein